MKSFVFTTVMLAMGAALFTASACAPPATSAQIHNIGAKAADPADISAAAKACLTSMARANNEMRSPPKAFMTCEVKLPEKPEVDTTDPKKASLSDSATTAFTLALAAVAGGEAKVSYEWVKSARSFWIKKRVEGLFLNLNLALDTSALPKADTKSLAADSDSSVIPADQLAFELSDQCTSLCQKIDGQTSCSPGARMNNKFDKSGLKLAVNYLIGGKIAVSGFKVNVSGNQSLEAPAAANLALASQQIAQGNQGSARNAFDRFVGSPQRRNSDQNPGRTPAPTQTKTDDSATHTSDEDGTVATADQTLTFLAAPNSSSRERAVVVASWPDRGVFYPRGRDKDNAKCGSDFECMRAARRSANAPFCQAFSNKVNEWVGMKNPDDTNCAGLTKPTLDESGTDVTAALMAFDSEVSAPTVSSSGTINGATTHAPTSAPAAESQADSKVDGAAKVGSLAYWSKQFTTDDLIPTLGLVCSKIDEAKKIKVDREKKAQKDQAAREGKPTPKPTPVVYVPNANDPMK